ncbi:MAG: O-sialoglycoprotein endopeptidase [Clostridia bacterium]|nr:O-sialoglycoprotein endopeptidase [Clostridia bacterium]
MIAVLGLDTSCYTTSAALVSLDGELLRADRRLLRVPEGKRGLMQSEMVFQHVQALPERIASVTGDAEVCIAAVSASTRPRPADDSYMPAFRAGESQARTAARLLRVPFYPFSHQEGHVRAAAYQTKVDLSKPLLALHLSGGTTEVLRCENGQITCIGGSLDLHAGQLVDRTGVRLGLPFPCGPALEQLAEGTFPQHLLPTAFRGGRCSLSGAETAVNRLMESGQFSKAQIAAEVYDLLIRTVYRMIEQATRQTGIRQVLVAGGVAASAILRRGLAGRCEKKGLDVFLQFARPDLSGDNAVGIALLGADRLRAGRGKDDGHACTDH